MSSSSCSVLAVAGDPVAFMPHPEVARTRAEVDLAEQCILEVVLGLPLLALSLVGSVSRTGVPVPLLV